VAECPPGFVHLRIEQAFQENALPDHAGCSEEKNVHRNLKGHALDSVLVPGQLLAERRSASRLPRAARNAPTVSSSPESGLQSTWS
jgi:hypothetical protein